MQVIKRAHVGCVLVAMLLGYAPFATASEPQQVSLTKAHELHGQPVQFVDVRSDSEWAGGAIAGAVHIPVQQTDQPAATDELRKDQPVLTYCASGVRAERAARQLAAQGFEPVYYLAPGGFKSWRAAGYATRETR